MLPKNDKSLKMAPRMSAVQQEKKPAVTRKENYIKQNKEKVIS